jgi:hypothetical protein
LTWPPDQTNDASQELRRRIPTNLATRPPPVQRFLYGEGTTSANRPGYGTSPIRVFRRHDIARARVTLRPGTDPVELGIAHIDLYFFYDLDVAILVLEVQAAGLSLGQAQELLHRFGRTYPTSWSADG